MLWIQIFMIPVVFLAIYYVYLSFKRNHVSLYDFLFWTLVWLSFLVVDIWPSLLSPVVSWLGMYRALDLLTILGVSVTLIVVFYVYMVTRKIERKITELVENISLKKRTK